MNSPRSIFEFRKLGCSMFSSPKRDPASSADEGLPSPLNWTSPFGHFDPLSPEGSSLSFALSPFRLSMGTPSAANISELGAISPSIFSPPRPISSRRLKKKDYDGDNDFNIFNSLITENTNRLDLEMSDCASVSSSEQITVSSSSFQSPQSTADRRLLGESTAISPCNCKKSRCLKLYCECFAGLKYCDGCNCVDCNNNADYLDVREDAIRSTRERNPSAFQNKITSKEGHSTGCNCKQSRCLKKYCECFQGSAVCGTNCKCKMCLNYEGSDSLKSTRQSMDKSLSSRDRKRRESPSSILEISPSSNLNSALRLEKYSSDFSSQGTNLQSLHYSNEKVDNSSSNYYSAHSPVPSSSSNLGLDSEEFYSPSSSPTTTTPLLSHSSSGSSMHSDSRISDQLGSGYRHVNNSESLMKSGKQLPSSSSSLHEDLRESRKHSIEMNYRMDGDDDLESHASFTNNFLLVRNKRRKVNPPATIVYPFFGLTSPPMPKILALRVLEFLDNHELYEVSLVSSLWNRAAMDEALWE